MVNLPWNTSWTPRMTQVERGLTTSFSVTFSSKQGIFVIKHCQSILASKLLSHLETSEHLTLKLKLLRNYQAEKVHRVPAAGELWSFSQVTGTCWSTQSFPPFQITDRKAALLGQAERSVSAVKDSHAQIWCTKDYWAPKAAWETNHER